MRQSHTSKLIETWHNEYQSLLKSSIPLVMQTLFNAKFSEFIGYQSISIVQTLN